MQRPKIKARYREGVLQIPAVTTGFAPAGPYDGFPTGIRCPRCLIREIVYNGNYFCSGWQQFDFDNGARSECEWALPDVENEWGTDPHFLDLQDALIATQSPEARERLHQERRRRA